MLEAALAAKASGTDVVVGYVEPHGRLETERLLETLECLPTLAVRYRDMFARNSTSTRHCDDGRRSCWSTNWRTRT